jgi:hypothetical protein
LIRSDNTATVSALNKATSRGIELMPIVCEIFWLSVKHDIKITGSYIPGRDNVLADKISRLHTVFEANVARFLLSGMTDSVVCCRSNMSCASFDWLQSNWSRGLKNCNLRRLPLRE